MQEFILVLVLVVIGLVAAAWLIAGPLVCVNLWQRLRRVEDDLQQLQLEKLAARHAGEPATESDIWLAEPEPPAAVAPRDPETARRPTPAARPEPAGPPPRPPAPPPRPVAPVDLAGGPAATGSTWQSARNTDSAEPASLEELLAGKWLTWVGALAVIVGMGFFLKYSIDQGWLDETRRVALGLLIGMAGFAGGVYAMLRNYRFFAQGLVGAAIGILYFSLFAGFSFYDGVISQPVAFAGMVLVTAMALAFSAWFDALSAAVLGLLGGFLTPLMLSTGQDAQWTLFSYILLLDCGVLGVATFRKWQALELLAFGGTLLIWIGWLEEFFAAERNLGSTVVLMTAFFVLFALLGIWQHIIRRRPAEPADFVLILATPLLYFLGLYGVTAEDFSSWHGEMALGLAAVYVLLTLFAYARNSADQAIVASLGGVAVTFLTIAAPLQLTGHWIALAWAAESLLLFELGVRFKQFPLRWAGLAVLMVVQLVLVYYATATVWDPDQFSTRFSDAFDPVARDILPYGVAGADEARPAVERAKPSWRDVFNGRSFSFLASAFVMSLMAWEYRRRGQAMPLSAGAPLGVSNDTVSLAGHVLLAGVPLTLLAAVLLESYAIGHRLDWTATTLISVFAAWAAAIGLATATAEKTLRARSLRGVAAAIFGFAAVLLAVNTLGTFIGWREQWGRLALHGASNEIWRRLLVNPRGFGYMATIAAAAVAAWSIEHRGEKRIGASTEEENAAIGAFLGGLAHLAAFALLTTEVYAQGVIRNWDTGTALAITLAWTAYATVLLLVGIVSRSAVLRVLSLALFVLTTAKVFLYDVWHLDTAIRTFAFIALGVALLLVSFLYRRFRDRIRAWIAPA